MASIITATTTSGLTQSADNSGVLQLASGTGNLVTVPAVTGTAMVSGNMPTFSATRTTNQSFSSNTWTKIQFDSENWDTASCYDPTTNFRFTPNVAGYYIITLNCDMVFTGTAAVAGIGINKNGAFYSYSPVFYGTMNSGLGFNGSWVVNFNGSTDYVEAMIYSNGASPAVNGGAGNLFAGVLVRVS
jgi:hypothetical protein